MKKVYGVYFGCIHEGGGVASPLYFDKDKAILAATIKYQEQKLKDEAMFEFDPDHAIEFAWMPHPELDNAFTNTVDIIIVQEFEII